jgi:hypothetical protein
MSEEETTLEEERMASSAEDSKDPVTSYTLPRASSKGILSKTSFWLRFGITAYYRMMKWLYWGIWRGMTWKQLGMVSLAGIGYSALVLYLFRLAGWI